MNETAAPPGLSLQNTEVAFAHKSNNDLGFSIFIFRLLQKPAWVKLFTKLTLWALRLRLPITWIVKRTIFRQFCGGETIESCETTLQELKRGNVGAILDYSVEGAEEESIFDQTRDELLRTIEKASVSSNIPVCCMKMTGIARFDLLQKVSESAELTDAEKAEYGQVVQRFEQICRTAFEKDTPIYIDAEETWIQPAIDRLTEGRMRAFNRSRAIVFTTLQMYRWDQLDHLKKLLSEGQREGFRVGVKFVRGAYLEKENNRAAEKGYPTPMQPDKASTDRDFDAAVQYALEHLEHIEFCAGTHNESSCLALARSMAERQLPNGHAHIWFSQLYGMSDTLSFNLAHAGYNVSKYLPYGPVKHTVPYLVRRAEENTAIAGQMGNELKWLLHEQQRRKKG